MQVTFDTSNATDVAFIRQLLSIAVPSTPTASAPVSANSGSGLPKVPAWAPAGSVWNASVGAPILMAPDGSIVPVAWVGSQPTPGKLSS